MFDVIAFKWMFASILKRATFKFRAFFKRFSNSIPFILFCFRQLLNSWLKTVKFVAYRLCIFANMQYRKSTRQCSKCWRQSEHCLRMRMQVKGKNKKNKTNDRRIRRVTCIPINRLLHFATHKFQFSFVANTCPNTERFIWIEWGFLFWLTFFFFASFIYSLDISMSIVLWMLSKNLLQL